MEATVESESALAQLESAIEHAEASAKTTASVLTPPAPPDRRRRMMAANGCRRILAHAGFASRRKPGVDRKRPFRGPSTAR